MGYWQARINQIKQHPPRNVLHLKQWFIQYLYKWRIDIINYLKIKSRSTRNDQFWIIYNLERFLQLNNWNKENKMKILQRSTRKFPPSRQRFWFFPNLPCNRFLRRSKNPRKRKWHPIDDLRWVPFLTSRGLPVTTFPLLPHSLQLLS